MRKFGRKISINEMQIQDGNSSDYGINASTLMECAGYSATQSIIQKYHLKKGDHVTIFCGTGNNGGDGFVISRHLLSEQMIVAVILVGTPDTIRTSEARHNWAILQNFLLNLSIFTIKDSSFFKKIPKKLEKFLEKGKVIIDCILGTGIRGKIREPECSAIEFINSFKKEPLNIISIDVPSGIDPNSGEKANVWVNADYLITFHQKKIGFDNIDIETIINPIGIPVEADLFVGSGDIKFTIPRRKIEGHKGQYGKILIIGGSEQYSGAPALAGMAALQMGMDLVYIFAPKSVADVIRTYSPNLIVRSGSEDNICEKDLPSIEELATKTDVIVIGPGLGTTPQMEMVFPQIISMLKNLNKPVVVDANAIGMMKSHKKEIPSLNVIFTPHSNEFYQLTEKKLPDQSQFIKRIKTLEKITLEWKTIFLVKGRYDYISNGTDTRINKTGVPEMAVGGTGDILAGILGSLLAIKIEPFSAACCAAYINGKLGEHYQIYHKGTIKNGIPLKSSDLLEYIPKVLKEYT